MTSFDSTHAKCKGQLDLFFSDSMRKLHAAKSICQSCPLKEECGEWAIKNHTYNGVWGGMTSREIQAERRRRGIVLPPHYSRAYGYIRQRKENNLDKR